MTTSANRHRARRKRAVEAYAETPISSSIPVMSCWGLESRGLATFSQAQRDVGHGPPCVLVQGSVRLGWAGVNGLRTAEMDDRPLLPRGSAQDLRST